MLGDSANCVFTGAVGKDEFGRLLMKQCDEACVETLLYVQQEEPTSTCAALISGNEGHRSMVSHLSGANTYPKDYLQQGEKSRFFTLYSAKATQLLPSFMSAAVTQHSYLSRSYWGGKTSSCTVTPPTREEFGILKSI